MFNSVLLAKKFDALHLQCMNPLAKFCRAPSWLVPLIFLLNCMSDFDATAQEGPHETAGLAQALLGDYSDNGYALRKVSTEELLRFLKSDRTLRIHAGLSGLTARNRIRDAIPWLLDRMRKNDPQLESYYRRFLSSLHGDIEDWERGVLIHLLEADPLESLETISVHGVSRRLGKLPEEWAAILRGYLNEQLTDKRKQWWAEEAERDKRGQLEPDHEVNCQALSEGIRLLDTLNDPADVPLLQSLLEHPAANSIAYHDGSSTLGITRTSPHVSSKA
jgi:hypothetical protein